MDIQKWYAARLQAISEKLELHQSRKNRLGIGRLVSFLAAVILFFLFLQPEPLAAVALLTGGLALFLYFLFRDIRNQQQLQHLRLLKRINEQELQALQGDYRGFEDGSRFMDPSHPYTADLDIFGPASLFQYLNRTTTGPAATLLADWLSAPAERHQAVTRQQSVEALRDMPEWRQELQACGLKNNLPPGTWQQVRRWLTEEEELVYRGKWQVLPRLLPVATLLFILLIALMNWSWTLLWIPLVVHYFVSDRIRKDTAPVYGQLSGAVKALASFEESLAHIEAAPFGTPYLQALQQRCRHDDISGSLILKRLKKLLHRFEYRLNPLVYIPLQLLFFWDFYQYSQLRQWKKQYAAAALEWMGTWNRLEVLSSLANLAFNQPGWVFPRIAEKHFQLEARQMGHPLLPPQKRVYNDLTVDGAGRLLLITGSNMAGKSTFLRTVGINTVLALAGAPVCAAHFTVSRVTVYSSMRIADNLEESISTFYAELKKLETILQRVRAHEKVLLLLDEILRGTNSQDRHTGSQALIRQLIREDAAAILATHDLALTGMAAEFPGQLENYHFDVQVQGEELYFDYKLREGICRSMNASILMRKIGLEV